jgi:hypothetical protein
MTKTLRTLALASAFAISAAAPGFAAGGSLGSQHVTQDQLGAGGQNQMLSKPATGSAQTGTSGTYGMNTQPGTGTGYSNPQVTTSGPGSATNPVSPSPSGGGASDGSAGGGSGGNSSR